MSYQIQVDYIQMSEDLLTFDPYYYNIRESEDENGKSVHIRITANSNTEQIIMKQSLLIKKLKQERSKHIKTIQERNFIIKQMVDKMKEYEQQIMAFNSNDAGPRQEVIKDIRMQSFYGETDKQNKIKQNLDMFQKMGRLQNQNERLRKEIEKLSNDRSIIGQMSTKSQKQMGSNQESNQNKELKQKFHKLKQKYNKLKKQNKQFHQSLNEIQTIEFEEETVIFNEVQCQTDESQLMINSNLRSEQKEPKINQQLNSKVEFLNSLIQSKDNEINKLKESLKAIQQLLAQKEKSIGTFEKHIQNIKSESEHNSNEKNKMLQQKVKTLEQVNMKRQREINYLRQLTSQNKSDSQIRFENDNKVIQLNNRIKLMEQQQKNRQLKQVNIKQKQEKIVELQKTLERQRGEKDQLREQIEYWEDLKNQGFKDIKKKYQQELIKEKANNENEKVKQNEDLENKMKQNDEINKNEIQKLKKNIAELQKTLERQRGEKDQLREQIEYWEDLKNQGFKDVKKKYQQELNIISVNKDKLINSLNQQILQIKSQISQFQNQQSLSSPLNKQTNLNSLPLSVLNSVSNNLNEEYNKLLVKLQNKQKQLKKIKAVNKQLRTNLSNVQIQEQEMLLHEVQTQTDSKTGAAQSQPQLDQQAVFQSLKLNEKLPMPTPNSIKSQAQSVQQYKQQYSNKCKEISNIQSKLLQQQKLIDTLAKQNEELLKSKQKQKQNEQKNYQQIKQAQSIKDSQITELQANRNQILTKLQEKDKQLQRLKQLYEKDVIQKINQIRSAKTNQIEELQKRIMKLNQLQGESSQKDKQIQQLNVKIDELKSRLLEKEKQMGQIKESQKQFIQNQMKKLDHKDNQIAKLNQEIKNANTEAKEKERQIEQLQQLRNDSQTDKDKQIQLLRSQIKAIQQNINIHAQQTKATTEQREQKEKENEKDKVIKQLQLKLSKLEKKQRQLLRLKEVNKKLTSDLEILQFQEEQTLHHEVQCQTSPEVTRIRSSTSENQQNELKKLASPQLPPKDDKVEDTQKSRKSRRSSNSGSPNLFSKEYVERIQKNYDELTKQFDDQVQSFMKLVETNKQLNLDFSKTQQAEKSANEKLQLQTKKITELLKQNNLLQKKVEEKQKQIEHSKPIIKQSIEVIENYEETIKTLQREGYQKDKRIGELQNRIAALNKDIKDLRDDTDTIVKNLNQTKSVAGDYPNLIQKISQSESSNSKLKKQLQSKTSEINRLSQQISNVKSFLRSLLNYAGLTENQQQTILNQPDSQKFNESTESVINKIMWKSIDQLHDSQKQIQIEQDLPIVCKKQSQIAEKQQTQQQKKRKQEMSIRSMQKVNPSNSSSSLQISGDFKNLPLIFVEKSYDENENEKVKLDLQPLYIAQQNTQRKKQQNEMPLLKIQSKINEHVIPKQTKSLQIQSKSPKMSPLKLPLMMAPSSPKNSINIMPLLARTEPYHNQSSKAESQFLVANLQSLEKTELQSLLKGSISKISTILQQLQRNSQVRQKNIRQIADNVGNGNLCQFLKNKDIVRPKISQ